MRGNGSQVLRNMHAGFDHAVVRRGYEPASFPEMSALAPFGDVFGGRDPFKESISSIRTGGVTI